jgi:hypothetical protein
MSEFTDLELERIDTSYRTGKKLTRDELVAQLNRERASAISSQAKKETIDLNRLLRQRRV